MNYTRKRTDRNHAEIGKALRRVTEVLDVHAFGPVGCDYIARHVRTKQPMFIEVKDGEKPPSERKLTDNERATMATYPLNYAVVLTIDDALRSVGL